MIPGNLYYNWLNCIRFEKKINLATSTKRLCLYQKQIHRQHSIFYVSNILFCLLEWYLANMHEQKGVY